MSSKNHEPDGKLQRDLQNSTADSTFGANVARNDERIDTQTDDLSSHAPVAQPSSEAATEQPAHDSDVFSGSSAAAALIGEPDTLPLTFCKRCNVDVKPEGKGLCPRCHKMLRHNFLARKHPVNKLRREQLLDKLVADYRPHTTLLKSTCEMLAGVLEQLEVLKPGSADHQRLVTLSQTLGENLEAHRASRPASSDTLDIDNASDAKLIETTTEILRQLLELGDAPRVRSNTSSAAGPVVQAERDSTEPPTPTLAPAPKPDAICEYCGRKCVGEDHAAFLYFTGGMLASRRYAKRN